MGSRRASKGLIASASQRKSNLTEIEAAESAEPSKVEGEPAATIKAEAEAEM